MRRPSASLISMRFKPRNTTTLQSSYHQSQMKIDMMSFLFNKTLNLSWTSEETAIRTKLRKLSNVPYTACHNPKWMSKSMKSECIQRQPSLSFRLLCQLRTLLVAMPRTPQSTSLHLVKKSLGSCQNNKKWELSLHASKVEVGAKRSAWHWRGDPPPQQPLSVVSSFDAALG